MDDGASEALTEPTAPAVVRPLDDLIFVAFNGRAFAIDRYDGSIVWRFKLSKGSGFAAIMLDGDRLIVSSQGYTHCLDPWRGTLMWLQEFSGEGMGVPSLASVRGGATNTGPMSAQMEAEAAQARAAGH